MGLTWDWKVDIVCDENLFVGDWYLTAAHNDFFTCTGEINTRMLKDAFEKDNFLKPYLMR